MKKKYKEGIQNLSKLIKNKPQPIREHLDICLACRAYGYAASGQYENALRDFHSIKKLGKCIDKASHYNKLVCQGIVQGNKGEIEKSTASF
mmetsp:Transcript_31633/g.5721  ORF Transcript_31633/g.5721 Transcript_31633/m.5721 type:complete len:91 (+) Transcript_31633:1217-1489(+)